MGGAQQFLQGHSSNCDTEVGLGREMPLPPTLPGSSPETQRAVPGEREETEHVLASSPAWLVTHAGPWSSSLCREAHRYSGKLLGSESQAGAEPFLLSLIDAEARTGRRCALGTQMQEGEGGD